MSFHSTPWPFTENENRDVICKMEKIYKKEYTGFYLLMGSSLLAMLRGLLWAFPIDVSTVFAVLVVHVTIGLIACFLCAALPASSWHTHFAKAVSTAKGSFNRPGASGVWCQSDHDIGSGSHFFFHLSC